MSKHKPLDKNVCMDFHVMKRFKQRFCVSINRKDIKEMINLIKTGKSEAVYALSNTKKVHRVSYKNKDVCCVYNSLRKRIHTVFPTEWIDNGAYDNYLQYKGYEVKCEN